MRRSFAALKFASVSLCLIAHMGFAEAASTAYLVIVQGLGGEDFYEQQFTRNSQGLLDIARSRWGLTKTNVFWLRPDAPNTERSSRRAEVLEVIDEIVTRSRAGDKIMLVYFGHISAQGTAAKFNLPGPDLTDVGLAEQLEELAGRQVAVVLAAASSGAMLRTLSAPSRIVVTATASGREKYVPRFGEFFVAGWIAPDADADKDGVVNLYEVFEHTRREVRQAFERENRLITEHALLDDNGDGHSSKHRRRGQTARDTASELDDGSYARRFSFQFDIGRNGVSEDELALTVSARQLAQAVESLGRERAQMSPQAYRQKLEALLVELALNRRRLRETLRR